MRPLRHALLATLTAFTVAVFSAPAGMAQDTIRIAQQFGLSYLPLTVAIEHKLFEKHAEAAGIREPKVDIARLASGAAVNDAIISGIIPLAA